MKLNAKNQNWRNWMVKSTTWNSTTLNAKSTTWMPNPTITCHSKHIQKYWMLTIIIDVMVCVMETTLDISIRIEIVHIFDFQINVHKHVEEKNQPFGVTFFKEVMQITTSNTLHYFLLTLISCHVIWWNRLVNKRSWCLLTKWGESFVYLLRSSYVVLR